MTAVKPRYDLIVVGGGIYGAALLWETARRGLSAILLERSDFAGGASANSLKIIHGGIRYLQRLDIPRIRASAREQRFFLREMPHLVQPLACVSPCYGHGIASRAAYQMAFWAYALLNTDIRTSVSGKPHPLPAGRIFAPEKLRAGFRDLNITGNTGTAKWFDALALDTERIVLTLIAEACDNGAQAINYSEMQGFLTEGKHVIGIEVKDRLNGEEVSLRADRVVTCTGDASTDTKNLSVPKVVFGPVQFVRAVNLIVKRPAPEWALALRTARSKGKSGHRRLLFFVPWQGATMVGTWYFPSQADDGARCLHQDELDLILSQVNAAFPALAVREEDITFVHLGRLPALPGKSRSGEPRLVEHGRIIDHGRSSGWQGLWSVVGVKYTTARAVAEKVLDRIFGKPALAPLRPAHDGRLETRRRGESRADGTRREREGRSDGEDRLLAQLSAAFGRRAAKVAAWAGNDPAMRAPVPGWKDLPCAGLHYAIQHESVWHLTDLLLRRSNIGAAARPAPETVDWALDQLGRHLGWSAAQKQSEIKMLDEHYNWWR